jgi:hypothetical protein
MNAVQLSNFNTREKHYSELSLKQKLLIYFQGEYFQFVILALILINLIIVFGQLAISKFIIFNIFININ